MSDGLAIWLNMSTEDRRIFLDRYFPGEEKIGGMTKEEIIDAPIGLVPEGALKMAAAWQRTPPGTGERQI